MMDVIYFECLGDCCVARTDTDKDGRCVITCLQDGVQVGRCVGWIDGGELFAPRQDHASDLWDEKGGPNRGARWYRISTGQDANHGAPGRVLSTFPRMGLSDREQYEIDRNTPGAEVQR